MGNHPSLPKIAYIMSRFPHLPETFILREMNAMAAKDWPISLYPLILQEQSIVHPEAQSWLKQARSLPFFSWGVVKANAKYLFSKPGRFLNIWWRTIRENLTSPNLLIRALALLPKAAYAAHLMEEEKIDHIHSHYATHPALVAWIIHQLTGISYSITVHAHDIFVRTAMIGTKLESAAFIAAISHYNRGHLKNLVGDWVVDKTHIVHCGITPQNYLSRSNLLKSGDQVEMITIGSLQPYKGQKYLIEACAHLKKWGIPFRCRIIGEGAERPNLEKLIAAHQLQTSVELLGAKTQEEVAQLLPTAHCYIQPSIITESGKMEGIPVSIMEAMACNLPVIATRLSGVPELVRDGETGYLVEPEDSVGLANAIVALSQDYQTAEQRAQAGQALVYKEFELLNNVDHLASLFEKTIPHTSVS